MAAKKSNSGVTVLGYPRQLSEHFHSNEFKCKDGSEHEIDVRLITRLEILRFLLSKHFGYDCPIRILSGYRSSEYNAKVGGVDNSYHVQGKAADIDASRYGVDLLFNLAKEAGFWRIGKYYNQHFVHVDVGEKPSPAYWIK